MVKYLIGITALLMLSAPAAAAQNDPKSPVNVFLKRAPKTSEPKKAERKNVDASPEQPRTEATQTAVTAAGRAVILDGDGTWRYADTAQTPATNTEFIRSTLLIVSTDQTNFVEVPVYVSGKIEVSSYYNYGYTNAEKTHYSFRLKDDKGEAAVYMPRGELSSELRRRILANGGELEGLFYFKILKSRYKEESAQLLVELISYK